MFEHWRSFDSWCHVTYDVVPCVTNGSLFVTVETRRRFVDGDVQHSSISSGWVWYMAPDCVNRPVGVDVSVCPASLSE